MTTMERYIFLFAIAITLTLPFCSAEAHDWDYYYEPAESYYVQPTLPGLDAPDYSRPGMRIEVDRYGNEQAYPTLPGLDARDYSQPGYRIDRR